MVTLLIATLPFLTLSILVILTHRMNRKTALKPIPIEKRNSIHRRKPWEFRKSPPSPFLVKRYTPAWQLGCIHLTRFLKSYWYAIFIGPWKNGFLPREHKPGESSDKLICSPYFPLIIEFCYKAIQYFNSSHQPLAWNTLCNNINRSSWVISLARA